MRHVNHFSLYNMALESTVTIGKERSGTERPDHTLSALGGDVHAEIEMLARNGISPVERDACNLALRLAGCSAEQVIVFASHLKRNNLRPEELRQLIDTYPHMGPGGNFPKTIRAGQESTYADLLYEIKCKLLDLVRMHDSPHLNHTYVSSSAPTSDVALHIEHEEPDDIDPSLLGTDSLEAADTLRAALEPLLPERVTLSFEQIGHNGEYGLIVVVSDDVPMSADAMRQLLDKLIATHHLNASVPIDVRKTTFD